MILAFESSIIQTKPNFALSTKLFQYCQFTDKCCLLRLIHLKLKRAHENQEVDQRTEKWEKFQLMLIPILSLKINLVLPCRIGKGTGIILSVVCGTEELIENKEEQNLIISVVGYMLRKLTGNIHPWCYTTWTCVKTTSKTFEVNNSASYGSLWTLMKSPPAAQ